MSIVNQLIGRGPKFPFVPSRTNGVQSNGSLERINQSLLILFGTNKGSRLFMPHFGSDLYKYRFDPYDDILIVKLRETILSDVKTWEPRIIINEIKFYDDDISKDNSILYISLDYTVISTETKGNFVFPFQRGEVYNMYN